MQFKEALAEANPCRHLVEKHNSRLPIGKRGLWIGMHAQVTGVAHQEQRCQVTQRESQPCQPTAHSNGCLSASMASRAECDQVLKAISRLVVNLTGLISKRPEGDLVMHVVSTTLLRESAYLATITIAEAGRVTLPAPARSVFIGIALPQAQFTQALDSGFVQGKPIARGEQLRGWQCDFSEA